MSPLRTDTFDLGGLRLTAGEGRRLDLYVGIEAGSRQRMQGPASEASKRNRSA